MTISDIYRILVLVTSIGAIVIMILVARKYHERWLYAVPPTAILVNLLLFAIARLLSGHDLSPVLISFFNNWANIVQLHTILTIALIGVYYLCQKR